MKIRLVLHPTARRLRAAVALLFALDLAGGLLAVGSGVSTWADAWGNRALLAAPWPMVGAQLLLAWLSTRTTRRLGALPACLLALACLVSAVSGFFDGGLGHHRLSGGLVLFQVVLLTATAAVGLLAAARTWSLWHGRRRRVVG
jgi:hypothetical protein